MADHGGRSRGGRGDGGGGEYRGRGRGGDQGGNRGDYSRGRGGGDGFSGRGRGRGDDAGGGFRGGRGRGGGPPPAPAQVFSYAGQPAPLPSQAVTDLENKVQARKPPSKPEQLAMTSLRLRESVRQPDRPAFGTKGQPVVLWANYFELQIGRKAIFYRYDFEVGRAAGDRADASGKKLEQVIKLLLAENHTFSSRITDIATDYRKSMVSAVKIPDGEISEPFGVTYRKEGEEEPRENAPVHDIKVTAVATHSASDLMDYVTSSSLSLALPNHEEFMRSMNLLLSDYAKRNDSMVTLGKSRSFSTAPGAARYDLGQGISALRGFFSSVRLGTSRVLLNVNVSHAAFYNHGPLEGLMQTHGGRGRSLEAFLRRVRVCTTHLPEKKKASGEVVHKAKVIAALAHRRDGSEPNRPRVAHDFAGPKDVEFWMDGGQPKAPKTEGKKKGKSKQPAAGPSTGGRYISVFDYFKEFYGITIQNPGFPVINVGTPTYPSYLPPQVCRVLPGQSYMGKLNPNQTAENIRFAVRNPYQNAESISSSGPQYIGFAPGGNEKLERFSIGLSNSLITVQGRVLPSPIIRYKKLGKETTVIVRDGGWNMLDIQFMKPGRMPKWSYLRITHAQEPGNFAGYPDLPELMQRFHAKLMRVGIQAAPPARGSQAYVPWGSASFSELEAKLRLAAEHFGFLIIILPADKGNIYDRVKQLCDLQLGMHTVSAVEPKLKKQYGQREDQYFANLALKVNLKLGGTNQVVEMGGIGLMRNDNSMLVGLDVTHPSPGSASTAPSVAAMVANIDSSLSQWPADLRVQQGRQEEVNDLEEMLMSRLDAWTRLGRRAKLPENILVFRDGVSESQYAMVRERELPLLRAACKRMYSAPEQKRGLPHISILVVGKRHHTRFYPTRMQDADRTGNPRPGTVVDRGVTDVVNWDFFLQPHTALQGTARPAHYYMVYDEIYTGTGADKDVAADPALRDRMLADELEALALATSHLFGRATKVISVAAPARYADLACDRSRVYLSHLFDPDSATETESTTTAGGRAGAGAMPQVTLHPKLKDTMFYV